MSVPLTPPPGVYPTSDPVESAPSPHSKSGSGTETKKTYLSLLSTEQIIEICLLFEPYVPPDIKTTVWPADLEAAILELKTKASSSAPSQAQRVIAIALTSASNAPPETPSSITPLHQVHPPGLHVAPRLVDEDPPMGSLRDPAEEPRAKASSSGSAAATSTAPSPAPNSQANSVNPSSSQAQPTTSQSQSQSSPQDTTSQTSGQPQHAVAPPAAPYPYGSYGYPVHPPGQQSPYSHPPYYPPHTYPSHYPYPPYPPPPGYPTPAAGQGYSLPPPPPEGQPNTSANRPPPPPSNEDMPSYEEMIAEALLDCGDAEGAAPKDLFTWMAARYPLQTNFRPSASQALQKAYKRGRLEKRAGGKYRLNPSWEGGTTSRRTTRRPQTLAQTTYALHHPTSTPSSPFTTTPLQHHQHQHPLPYTYPYQYPYGHYPGYPPPPPPRASTQPPQDKPIAPAHPPTSHPVSATAPGEEKDETGENGDAWEAAQHILKAINFGSTRPATASTSTANAAAGPPPESNDFSALLSAMAQAVGTTAATTEPARTTLTEAERASLQAQLALLAAQLTEIAEGDGDDGSAPPPTPAASIPVTQPAQPAQPVQPVAPLPIQPSAAPAPPQATPVKAVEPPPPPIAVYAGAHLSLDVNAFPEVFVPPADNASGVQTGVELGEEDVGDDDDDMEDVVVPLAAGQAALRT